MVRFFLLVAGLAGCTSGDSGKPPLPDDSDSTTNPPDDSAPTDDSTPTADDADGDGSPANLDCDDGDASVFPGAPETCDLEDEDCDGEIDEDAEGAVPVFTDADADGVGAGESTLACPGTGATIDGDCDDTDGNIYPLAEEICDGIDNNCDAVIDPNTSWGRDADADGFGDAADTLESCEAPGGYVSSLDDCDDSDSTIWPGAPELDCADLVDRDCDGVAAGTDLDGDAVAACVDCDDTQVLVYPGAPEVCNGVDDDCDGLIDPDSAVGMGTWYQDQDNDGWGDTTAVACEAPAGYVGRGGDCDDADATVFPGGEERCGGADEDCDSLVDESGATGEQTFYQDLDADGAGDPAAPVTSCGTAGEASLGDDCDDTDPTRSPSAPEQCNGVDDDCDTLVDDEAIDAPAWYADTDADGFGRVDSVSFQCDGPVGFVADATDCDDAASDIWPGAPERCDGLDQDCDGVADNDPIDPSSWYDDDDGDGFGTALLSVGCTGLGATLAGDCDDNDPAVSPSGSEDCNGVDDDCDGETDEASLTVLWYRDADGDNFGTSEVLYSCTQPAGYGAGPDDCDDAEASVYPGAPETCDSRDEDCDGDIDEDAVDANTWYFDDDDDGFGDPATAMVTCDAATYGYRRDGRDCDDTDRDIYPYARETTNGVDDDCDGRVDGDDTGVITVVPGEDDGGVVVGLDVAYPHCGDAWSEVWFASNGWLVFGDTPGDFEESFAEFGGFSAVAGVWDDLDASSGGEMSWQRFDDATSFYWEQVPELGSSSRDVTFTITLLDSGRVNIHYGDVDVRDGVSGVSCGTASGAAELDLSREMSDLLDGRWGVGDVSTELAAEAFASGRSSFDLGGSSVRLCATVDGVVDLCAE